MTSNLKIEHYILGKTIGTGASSKVKSIILYAFKYETLWVFVI